MAGGVVETDPEKIAQIWESFQKGAKTHYETWPNKGDMWFFELYHHITDTVNVLRKSVHFT